MSLLVRLVRFFAEESSETEQENFYGLRGFEATREYQQKKTHPQVCLSSYPILKPKFLINYNNFHGAHVPHFLVIDSQRIANTILGSAVIAFIFLNYAWCF